MATFAECSISETPYHSSYRHWFSVTEGERSLQKRTVGCLLWEPQVSHQKVYCMVFA